MTDRTKDLLAQLAALDAQREELIAPGPGVVIATEGTMHLPYLILEAVESDWRCLRVSLDSELAGPRDLICAQDAGTIGARRVHTSLEVRLPRSEVTAGVSRLSDPQMLTDCVALYRGADELTTVKTVYPRGRPLVSREAELARELAAEQNDYLRQRWARASAPNLISVVVEHAKLWWAQVSQVEDELVFAADAVDDDTIDAGLRDESNRVEVAGLSAGQLSVILVPGENALAIWQADEATDAKKEPEVTVFSATEGVYHEVVWTVENQAQFTGTMPWSRGATYDLKIICGDETNWVQITFPG